MCRLQGYCFPIFNVQSYAVLMFLFFYFFRKNYCTPQNTVTSWDVFMKLYRNVYNFKIMCRIQLRLLSVPELWPSGCVLSFMG